MDKVGGIVHDKQRHAVHDNDDFVTMSELE